MPGMSKTSPASTSWYRIKDFWSSARWSGVRPFAAKGTLWRDLLLMVSHRDDVRVVGVEEAAIRVIDHCPCV